MSPNDTDALRARIEVAPAHAVIEVSAAALQEMIRDSQPARDNREADLFFTSNKKRLLSVLEEIRGEIDRLECDLGNVIDEIRRLK